jgi:hypothetical protein
MAQEALKPVIRVAALSRSLRKSSKHRGLIRAGTLSLLCLLFFMVLKLKGLAKNEYKTKSLHCYLFY